MDHVADVARLLIKIKFIESEEPVSTSQQRPERGRGRSFAWFLLVKSFAMNACGVA
jgi:hypothetical protein